MNLLRTFHYLTSTTANTSLSHLSGRISVQQAV